ncbi:MAG TPA: cytochrome c [Novimethylophilus sp.]|uniref:c-type cytochrome n=1 Tax=Novimethylophilus sp. TaxID=2137426 RepID=UPI002F418E15
MSPAFFKWWVLVLALASGHACAGDGNPDRERQGELIRLIRHDCGSCHGLTLAGGLGPALLPDTLRGRPAQSLAQTILHGRAGTPMPSWGRFVSEAEAEWMVQQLMKGLPDAR